MVSILLIVGEAGCMSTEDKVLNYLEDKYHQKFEIEGVKKGSLFFSQMYGGDKVTVHSKENPEIVFLVEEDSEENGVYYDNYVLAKWAEELKGKLAADIEKELPPGSPYKILVYVAPDKYDKSMVNMDFEDYLNNVNRDFKIVVKVGIKTAGEPDVNLYNQNIFNLYNLVKKLGTERYAVSVGFVDRADNISDYIRTAYVNNIPWSNLKARVFGEIILNDRHDPLNGSADQDWRITGPEKVIDHYTSMEE